MLSNVILNLLLVGPLAHAGLALATSLSAFINAGLLFFLLRRKDYYQPSTVWWCYLLKIVVAVSIMAVLLYSTAPVLETWLQWDVYHRAGNLLLWIGAGALVYFISLILLGIRPKQMTAPH